MIHCDITKCNFILLYQAIECSLNGVKKDALSLDYELDELVNFMFNLTQDILYAKVCELYFSKCVL